MGPAITGDPERLALPKVPPPICENQTTAFLHAIGRRRRFRQLGPVALGDALFVKEEICGPLIFHQMKS